MKKSKIHQDNISRLHKDKLGMDVPEGFFKKSKEDILNAVTKDEQPKQKVFWLRPMFAYPIAAALVLAIAITFWIQNNDIDINDKITNTEDMELLNSVLSQDDFLVSSLLIEDDDLDKFMDEFILNEIVVEAELSEQKLENIFINSLFVEDSLIETYLDKSLIENVVL